MPVIDVYDLGNVPYKKALNIQKNLLKKRINDEINDSLVLLQHPPTVTTGRRGNPDNLLVTEKKLNKSGITFEIISRGGDATFHGPGQLVGYPIMDLSRFGKDVHKYLRDLEKLLILTLSEFNIESRTIEKLTGVWVKRSKIASIGIGVRRWTTYHGFALNVNTDLSFFDLIVPCGIPNVRMTSIKDWLELDQDIDMSDVREKVINNFAKLFNYNSISFKHALSEEDR